MRKFLFILFTAMILFLMFGQGVWRNWLKDSVINSGPNTSHKIIDN